MTTQYVEIFSRLAAPFAREEVKDRTQANRKLHYITARTAMNRLDDVIGPENWWDEYLPGKDSVLCRLSIRLPDGQVLTKCDAGGYAGMADSGDDDKSGYSDAFKRAAVKLGVARYLYRDGVPEFVRQWVKNPAPAPAPPPELAPEPEPAPAAGPVKSPMPWGLFLARKLRQANGDWQREMTAEGVDSTTQQDHLELANSFQVVNHIATRLVELGKFTPAEIGKEELPAKRDPEKARAAVVQTYFKNPKSIEKAIDKYLLTKRMEHRVELGLDDGVASGDAEH